MVHEKTDRTQYPILHPQFQLIQSLIPFTVEFIGLAGHSRGHRLVHKFFAKYMLQIDYITYCTMVSKCYLHLFFFSFVLFQ